MSITMALEFAKTVAVANEKFLQDFKATPPANMSEEAMEAYCAGFREATAMYTAVVVTHFSGKTQC